MDLVSPSRRILSTGFPHTRGDGPEGGGAGSVIELFSPHTWGWTYDETASEYEIIVFPTHVGMDLSPASEAFPLRSFPHTRGDGPKARIAQGFLFQFSPHTWGWTFAPPKLPVLLRVFPTHVGMDL